MKQITTIILLTVTFFAGNAKSLYQHEQASEKLVLNNGAKWKIDQPTSKNVTRLQQIAGKAGVRTLADYHQAGAALQAGINQMIKECRMKGPDHLALHKWLEPLMEQVALLNQATNAASAKIHFNEVKKRLTLFNQYFQ
ncbi:hypothetical protein [Mucilaginibacter ginsenosidivorans]|uniref:Uncharacterized protein n=1 Tax=Mucilaginibacter ginsenosidivorans TaxID=398053 RepID=A0A5B8UVB1_9SPHI|nr:hypothetical protein [Mucilaginibacter ginsenosidivorans]QEC62376.1 hypothetical protein FRZ54_07190 [Mucilaginibacter ginsenosidivorans]HVW95965.1 hypothetical protein [Mucilaginibacter sp.]